MSTNKWCAKFSKVLFKWICCFANDSECPYVIIKNLFLCKWVISNMICNMYRFSLTYLTLSDATRSGLCGNECFAFGGPHRQSKSQSHSYCFEIADSGTVYLEMLCTCRLVTAPPACTTSVFYSHRFTPSEVPESSADECTSSLSILLLLWLVWEHCKPLRFTLS